MAWGFNQSANRINDIRGWANSLPRQAAPVGRTWYVDSFGTASNRVNNMRSFMQTAALNRELGAYKKVGSIGRLAESGFGKSLGKLAKNPKFMIGAGIAALAFGWMHKQNQQNYTGPQYYS